MELLQNPEVHQLDHLVFDINLSHELILEGYINRSNLSVRIEFDLVTKTITILGQSNLQEVTRTAFHYVCDCSHLNGRRFICQSVFVLVKKRTFFINLKQ